MHNTAKPEEIRADAVVDPNSLYLYGTDYMSTSEIKDYLIHFPAVRIRWINDSSCTLGFPDETQTEQAYNAYSVKPLESDPSLNFDERNFDSKIGWREALAYQQEVKGWQSLWIRYATDLDVKKEATKGQDSRFYRFSKAQDKSHFRKKGIQKKEKYQRKPKDLEREEKEADTEMADTNTEMAAATTEPAVTDAEVA